MAKSNKELMDFWFSYSGEDHHWLEELAKEIEQSQQQAMLSDDISSKFCEAVTRCRFFINRYKYGEDQYHLLNGMDIGELLFDIGNGLLRAVVLSEHYFKKPFCLQELCLCLCSTRFDAGNYPLMLMRDDLPLKNLLNTSFTFAIPVFQQSSQGGTAQSQTNQNETRTSTTLADALAQTHQYLRRRYPDGMHGFDFAPLDSQYFHDRLNKIESRLYIPCQQLSYDAIANQVLAFCFKTIEQFRDENCLGFLHGKYKQLMDNSAIQKVITHLEKNGDIDMEKAFVEISSFKGVQQFLNKIDGALQILDVIRNDIRNKDVIARLCSLAIAKGFNSTKTQLLPKQAKPNANGILSVNVSSSDINFKNLLNAGFAYSIAHKNPLDLVYDDLAIDPDAARIKQVIHGQFRQKSGEDGNYNDAYTLFLNLVDYYWPDATDIPKSIAAAQSESGSAFIDQLRDEIELGIDDGNTVMILMRANKDRLELGYYTALSELDKTINNGFPEKYYFAVVELKEPKKEVASEAEAYELMSDNGYKRVKRGLVKIFKQFDRAK